MRAKKMPLKLSNLLSLFRPANPECLICRRRRAPAPEVEGVCCQECFNKITLIRRFECVYCGRPTDCPDCRRSRSNPLSPPALIMQRSAAEYDAFLKYCIAQYKYKGHERLRSLFQYVLQHGYDLLNSGPYDLITFVPISGPRAQERGFNQAEQLATEVAILTGSPVVGLLRREKDAAKQSQQTRAGRLKALDHVYGFDEEAYLEAVQAQTILEQPSRKLKILLIDDVYTTGSTMEACAQTLVKRLQADVYGLTLGRA